MSLLERWVRDKLQDILGATSDCNIAADFVGLAEKSTSLEDFISNLSDTGVVEVDADIASFAKELWEKVRSNGNKVTIDLYVSSVSLSLNYKILKYIWAFSLKTGEINYYNILKIPSRLRYSIFRS